MKVSLRLRSDAPSLSISTAEDLFFRSQCALWGTRIMSTYPRLDNDTLEYVIWVLDPTSGIVARILEDLGVKNEAVLQTVPESIENQAAALSIFLGRLDAQLQARAIKTLCTALDEIASSGLDCEMSRGLQHITNTYGLSEDECALAFFLASVSAWPHLERYFDNHLECDRPSGRKYLMTALGMSHKSLKQATGGKLARIGILDVSHTWLSLDSDYVPLFTDPSENTSLDNLHRSVPMPDLATNELGVCKDDISLVCRLLLAKGVAPVHILLYGVPGTGKTTLARGLIHENDLDGIEVMGRSEGTVRHRRGALEACLHMSAGVDDRIILVDEADRLLNTGSSWMEHGDRSDKAWLNDVLERPGLRCLWITNNVSEIDPAVRRRIDFSLELPVLDLRMRRTMLEKILGRRNIEQHFPSDEIRAIVRDYVVNPAIVAAAADTAVLAQDSGQMCRDTFIKALDSQLQLAGKPAPSKSTCQMEFYRCGINTDRPVESIESKVRAYDVRWRDLESGAALPSMNLLFHGAPGTGKSHTARYLADLIDRPVLVKRASDLLDPYVGMSERRVAGAFAEARNTGTILVIDEIDSFLYKRDLAQRTWEANLVSEFLVQLEQGPGMVIGTTNRIDAIDMASRRRFLMRVEFRFLDKDQVVGLYNHIFREIVIEKLSAEQIARLSSITNATAAGLFSIYNGMMLASEQSACHDCIIDSAVAEFMSLSKNESDATRAIGF